MDAAGIAEKQETDGVATQAQRNIRSIPVSAGEWSDQKDQSDLAWLGEILCHWALESVFLVYSKLGRAEDSAPSGACMSTPRPWLEAMEQGMAIRGPGTLL